MKILRSQRATASAFAVLALSSAPARADQHDITTGRPNCNGRVVIDIIDKATNFLIKSDLQIPAGIEPEEKAALIHGDIVARIAGSPLPFKNQFTATIVDNIITVKNAAPGGTTVKVIWDTTCEGNSLAVYPGGANWFQKLFRWIRVWPAAIDGTVVPPGAALSVEFDSIAGPQGRTLVGDGVKTVGELQSEFTSWLAGLGFTFTQAFVFDPTGGSRYELVSQAIAGSSPMPALASFRVTTSPEWTEFLGTMGLEVYAPLLGTPYCAGDGSLARNCPCGNFGAAGRGCNNSANTGGAQLEASGDTETDTVVLVSTRELPAALSIFLQGDANLPQGVVFGDGGRCVGGHLRRLYVHNASWGRVAAPQFGELPIRERSAELGDTIPGGATRFYQVYYRDPVTSYCASPAGNSFNASSAVAIDWP